MKNIHLIRARESRLYYTISMSGYNLKLSATPIHQSSEVRPQNIYITSDEEIKEGDWFMSNLNEILKCTKKEDKFVWYERLTVPGVSKIAQPFSIHINLKPKKIILTTDQDLIADGVQPIDDEFLEWFVKNPSCEGVETFIFGFDDSIISHSKKYEIIIPSEEPKDVVLGYKTSLDAQMLDKVELKQETLEQAAEQSFKTHHIGQQDLAQDVYEDGFVNGAKFMQERMYSEKDMIATFHYGHQLGMNSLLAIQSQHSRQPIDKPNLEVLKKEWFEQFKKK